MPKLEVSHQTAAELTTLAQQAQKSVDEIILWFMHNYGHTLTTGEIAGQGETWTDEELADLLTPKPSLTGRQIVEKHITSGAIGSWSDEGIVDGAEWVQQQRAKHRKKYQW